LTACCFVHFSFLGAAFAAPDKKPAITKRHTLILENLLDISNSKIFLTNFIVYFKPSHIFYHICTIKAKSNIDPTPPRTYTQPLSFPRRRESMVKRPPPKAETYFLLLVLQVDNGDCS
jgi:hypothetical protein